MLRERRAIVPLLERYTELKRSRDAMDFADQMALAARLALSVSEVGRAERSRFRAVLLDEFQDTSEAQLQLLRALFVADGDPVPVTAVGDPHQSIYGWRGASSTTLDRFRSDFADPEPATVLHLSTSWRNDRVVLDAANVVAAPLAATTRVEVRSLAARPDAGPGHVAVARLSTLEDEAEHVVGWLGERLRRPGRRTAAVLCRKRSQFDPVVEALDRAGLAYEVVGLGGLLHTPEVADLVALLHVVQDPTRGDRLMRLLTGPSCRLGAADLDGLGAWARQRQRTARAEGDRRADLSPDSSEEASLVEALDDLPSAAWVGEEGQRIGAVAPLPAARARPTPCGGCARSSGSGSPSSRPRRRSPSASTSRSSRAPSTPRVRRGHTSTPSPTSPRRSPPAPSGRRSEVSSPGWKPPSPRSGVSTSAGSSHGRMPCRS